MRSQMLSVNTLLRKEVWLYKLPAFHMLLAASVASRLHYLQDTAEPKAKNDLLGSLKDFLLNNYGALGLAGIFL